jgi:hypothetical protein
MFAQHEVQEATTVLRVFRRQNAVHPGCRKWQQQLHANRLGQHTPGQFNQELLSAVMHDNCQLQTVQILLCD